MRTITLEILRHGPPHNQLLSPLTPYLALCENHAAVTVNVPFEHAQFLHRLRVLCYELKDENVRRFQLEDTGRELGALLARIPSLIAEINQRGASAKGDLLHLRMIVSASELALLPFELAISPNGFPGEARALALQTSLPVCVTREVRQASGVRPEWNAPPRILVAAASPPGVAPIPLESHLLALRRAIDPWMHHAKNDEERREKLAQHLVVLPQASIEQIREQCAKGNFTHVHILAHGSTTTPRNTMDYQHGLVLHDSRNPNAASIVEGKTLARALRTDCPPSSTPARPLVVTVASCNSGQVGSVVTFAGAGASVAHALHSEGIPLVIASQFPLSFRGSVEMVEQLYQGFLNGEDPRCVLHDLRGRLQGTIPETHDWGSVVAYAALDARFERQLERFQVDQAHRRVNAALSHADHLVWLHESNDEEGVASPQLTDDKIEEMVSDAFQRVEDAKGRLRTLQERARQTLLTEASPASATEERDNRVRTSIHLAAISGLIAAAEKRHAEIIRKKEFYHLLPAAYRDDQSPGKISRSTRLFETALDAYWEAYVYDRTYVWAQVQHLFLTHLLGLQSRRIKLLPEERQFESLWRCALNASLVDIHSGDAVAELWARGNLLELRLLRMQHPAGKGAQNKDLAATGDPAEHIARIHALTVDKPGAHYSIDRQIRRYRSSIYNFAPAVTSKAWEFSQGLRAR